MFSTDLGLSRAPETIKSVDTQILYNSGLRGYDRPPDWAALEPTKGWSVYPVRRQTTLPNNPITTTNGSKTIRVNHPSHGMETGEVNLASGATAVAGLTWVGQPSVITKIDADTYDVLLRVPLGATSSTTGGGAAIVVTVLIDSVDIHLDHDPFISGGYGYGYRYIKGAVSPAIVGITQRPKNALVSGWTYNTKLTLSGMSAGTVTFKVVNNAAGAGEISAAVAHSTNATHESTIVPGASSTFVRVEMSADAIGNIAAPVEMRPAHVHLAIPGDRYIVSAGDAYGPWAGLTNKIVKCRSDGAWEVITPRLGERVFVEDEGRNRYWTGTEWRPEHKALMPAPEDVYTRYFKPPPGDSPNGANAGTPWEFHDPHQLIVVEGSVFVISKGGLWTSEMFPMFRLHDSQPNHSGAYGGTYAGGTRRGGVVGAWDIWEFNDTSELRLGMVLTDPYGKVIDFDAGGFNAVGRIYFEAMRLHPSSGKPIWAGRAAEILGYDLKTGGELIFKLVVVGESQQSLTTVAKFSSAYLASTKRTSLFLMSADVGAAWKQVQWVNAGAAGASLTTAHNLLFVDP